MYLIGAEADLALLQHHKTLNLGCCSSSPRSASEEESFMEINIINLGKL